MRNWNDRLKKAFDESDYNKTRFAKAVGVSGATVNRLPLCLIGGACLNALCSCAFNSDSTHLLPAPALP